MKALVLFSGGLDSIIAVKIAQEAGLEVEAIHFVNPFHQNAETHLQSVIETARRLQIQLHLVWFDENYLRVIENPRYGYGKHFNPCVDCRIHQLKTAKEKMEEIGAAILVTGEVLDQRPNSQRRDAMDIVERDAGVRGILLRPLCAKHLRPIPAELDGRIDRGKLLDIKGRGRTQQMNLAEHFSITEYPGPGGGCLLTYKEYGSKVRDLMQHDGSLNMHTIELLRYGRHFRLGPSVKLIVGKNEHDNDMLEKLADSNELLLETLNEKGPVALYAGPRTPETLELAAAITAGYAKIPPEKPVLVEFHDQETTFTIETLPLSREAIHKYFI